MKVNILFNSKIGSIVHVTGTAVDALIDKIFSIGQGQRFYSIVIINSSSILLRCSELTPSSCSYSYNWIPGGTNLSGGQWIFSTTTKKYTSYLKQTDGNLNIAETQIANWDLFYLKLEWEMLLGQ